MSLPAILNEVISVTGTYPFPYQTGANGSPIDPPQTVVGRTVVRPILVFGQFVNAVGSPADAGLSTGTGNNNNGGGGTGTGTGSGTGNNLGRLTAAEAGGGGTGGNGGAGGGGGNGGANNGGGGLNSIYTDRLLGSVNRNTTTDFAAPALDAPTFRRTFGGDGNDNNVFLQGGTSVSSAIVTGSYALVSSALEYWSNISKFGLTASSYLTTPVNARVLNYGQHQLFDLKAYNNPDGINSILAYSAVPAADTNDNLTVAGPPNILGSTVPRSFARVDVANAVATIEGKVALDYLLKHNTFNIIDANHDRLITAQELQNFVNMAATTGQPEAGAMARLLGGTARSAINTAFTAVGEQPDLPDVLQRRFNFFDYAAHGKLQGSVSIEQFKLLNKYILPTPDAYKITDRPRASANGFLLAPTAQRNFKDLQRLLPKYVFVPKGAFLPYKGTTPAQFGVNTNQKAESDVSPVYSLFNVESRTSGGTKTKTKVTVTPPVSDGSPIAPPAANSRGPVVATTAGTMTTNVTPAMGDSGGVSNPTAKAGITTTPTAPANTTTPTTPPATGTLTTPPATSTSPATGQAGSTVVVTPPASAATPTSPIGTTVTTTQTTVTTTTADPKATTPGSVPADGKTATSTPLAKQLASILTPKAADATQPPPVSVKQSVPQPPTSTQGKATR